MKGRDDGIIMLDPFSFTPFYNCNLVTCLADQGWSIEWITSDFPFETFPAQQGARPVPFFFSRFPAGCLLAAEAVRRNDRLRGLVKISVYPFEMARFNAYLKLVKPGILHVQWVHLPWLEQMLWKQWRRRGWKLVYTAHDPLPLDGTTLHPLMSAGQELLKTADAILVHSKNALYQLVKQGLCPDRIHIIQMGATLPTDMKPVSRKIARHELGLPAKALTILFFGFIKPYKGLDVLLKSMPKIQAVLPESRLVVAGKLMEPFSNYEHLMERLPTRPLIFWNLGFIPSHRIPHYFCAADVVVTPYHQGSSSSVIDLAHFFNKPVVTTAVGGLPEQIDIGRGDRNVPSNDPDSLADAVVDVLKRRRNRMDEGQEPDPPDIRVQEKWPAIAARHGELYSRLLKNP